MLSRFYKGEPDIMNRFKFTMLDFQWLLGLVICVQESSLGFKPYYFSRSTWSSNNRICSKISAKIESDHAKLYPPQKSASGNSKGIGGIKKYWYALIALVIILAITAIISLLQKRKNTNQNINKNITSTISACARKSRRLVSCLRLLKNTLIFNC